MKKFRLLAASMAIMLAAPVSAAVVNGSFELDPGVAGNSGSSFGNLPVSGRSWDVWSALPGWTTVGPHGIELQTNRTLGSIDAQDGNYYVEIDSTGNATIRQALALTKGRYLLSFWYSPRMANPLTNGMAYSIAGLSGTVVGPSSSGSTAVGKWTEFVFEFVAPITGVYNLDFTGTGTQDSLGGLLDNVAVSPVPVPAAGGMMAAGLLALGALRRRKRT